MNTRQIELIRRRERLLVRAETQREELAAIAQGWQMPLRVVDSGIEVLRTLRAHPLLWVTPLAVMVVARPRRVMQWGGKAWSLWRLWRVWRASPLAKWLHDAK